MTAFLQKTAWASKEGYTLQPFEHYQSILDRMPFGELPPDFNATPVDPATAKTEAQTKVEQQKLAKQVNMSAVNITPAGETAIGFTDLSEKPPVNYYLLVGGEAGGWKVLNADYDEEQATIEKDGVSITLKLGKGLVDNPAPTAAKQPEALPTPVVGANRERPPLRGLTMIRRGGEPPGLGSKPPGPEPIPGLISNGKGGGSYKERLAERQQQDTLARQSDLQKQQDQLVKLAREAAQKEIERRDAEAAQAAVAAGVGGAVEQQQDSAAVPADAQQGQEPQ